MDTPSRTYTTEGIEVDWYPERCIHSAYCIRSLPQAFDPRRRPWIVLDGQTADEIATAVNRCPSGALHYRRLDGAPGEPIPEETTVLAVPNGPLYVRGNVRVESIDGALLREDTRMALCRCGNSANKPFCDNSHLRIGFEAP